MLHLPKWALCLGLLAAMSLSASAADQKLAAGDPAPAVSVDQTVKGQAVNLKKGQVYVVEFWATWCGPCRASIPHLTQMAKTYKIVTFLGVSIDEEKSKVKPFVDEMGDKMDYNVAIDHDMNKTWMEAAGQDGIPTAFLVDKDSKIVWIGHPMDGLKRSIEKLLGEKYGDPEIAAKLKYENDAAARYKKLGKDNKAKVKLCREWFAKYPDAEDKHYELLLDALMADQPAEAAKYAQAVADKNEDNQFEVLFALCQRPKLPKEVAALAVKWAEGLDQEENGQDLNSAVLLCRAYTLAGESAKAAEAGNRAAKLVGDDEMPKMMADWIKQAQKAAGK